MTFKADPIIVAQRRLKAWDLKVKGYTYQQISEELGYSKGQVYNDVQAELEDRKSPLVEQIRTQETERLERYLRKLDARIEDEDDKAIGLAIKLSERLCRMHGADLPTKSEVSHIEISQVDRDIQELIAAERAKNILARGITEEVTDNAE